jgi:hypothetical protein
MPEFQTQTDIGNRALQHCGAEMMDAVLGFSEISKNARQVSFAYGKLRRAELRRNIWRFATRRAVLRPIDTNTLLLNPALWVSTTTYFLGSVVSDSANTLWISRIPNNTGNPPSAATSSSMWEPYFGPLTVMLYDSSTGYASGELVYTAAGDGTYNTYLSLASDNDVHPALPNQWSTNTTYFKNQVAQTWPAWASGTTYSKGQGVLYTDGNVYASLTNSNVGNTPSTSTTNWALVPVLTLATQGVPQTTPVIPPQSSPVVEWSQTAGYSLGNVVMFNGAEYLSLANSNTGNFPNAAGSTFWVALSGGTLSMSLINLNIGNNPANAPALFAIGTTYALNAKVGGSDGVIYQSKSNGNVGHDPTTDGGVNWTNTGVLNPWTTVFTQGGGNDQWMQIGGASFPTGVGLAGLNITYPVGSGPLSQSSTRNVYRLPAGFLRPAPQDPKAGSTLFLGAPSGREYEDWVYESDYIVSGFNDSITFRFIADVTDVTRMDDMFCECLAARIGLEVCEPLTQSSAKLATIRGIYAKWEADAITVNGIEIGAIEPPEDAYISCRV